MFDLQGFFTKNPSDSGKSKLFFVLYLLERRGFDASARRAAATPQGSCAQHTVKNPAGFFTQSPSDSGKSKQIFVLDLAERRGFEPLNEQAR